MGTRSAKSPTAKRRRAVQPRTCATVTHASPLAYAARRSSYGRAGVRANLPAATSRTPDETGSATARLGVLAARKPSSTAFGVRPTRNFDDGGAAVEMERAVAVNEGLSGRSPTIPICDAHVARSRPGAGKISYRSGNHVDRSSHSTTRSWG